MLALSWAGWAAVGRLAPAWSPGTLSDPTGMIAGAVALAAACTAAIPACQWAARPGGSRAAAPAVLPATLTIIERHEGRGPAVTEVEGAVPGAIALIGFAGVTAASTARIPLGAALLAALATWVAVAIGGYLTLAAIVPSWRQDVRTLAFHRRDVMRSRWVMVKLASWMESRVGRLQPQQTTTRLAS